MSLQTALIVDDSKSARFGLRKMLEKCHLSVELCESAEQAIQYLESQKPDVIFMDHIMPGMDGPTWVRMARESRPDLHVVFMSGYADGSAVEEQLSIPESIFLPKPFSLDELTSTVRRHMMVATA